MSYVIGFQEKYGMTKDAFTLKLKNLLMDIYTDIEKRCFGSDMKNDNWWEILFISKKINNMFEELQKIYDSEINFSISTFWDWWFTVKLWDDMNWYKAEDNKENFRDCVLWLIWQCYKHYPLSTYVQKTKKNIDKEYTKEDVKQIIAKILEDWHIFESKEFLETYMSNYNNWPEPDQIEKHELELIESYL